MTYDELLADLKNKRFSPVYLFHGEEDLFADEAVESLIGAALSNDEHGFNLDVMHGSDADVRDVVARAAAFPMMAERRVVVLRELEKLSSPELLTSYLENPSPTTCLVLLASKPDFRKKPYLTVKKHGVVLECKPLYDNQIPSWIVRRARQHDRDIDEEAAKTLAAHVGPSLREVQNELEKVYTFVGERRTITAADVHAVVGMSREYNIFELQRAVGMKDIRRSTEILERMLDVGESAIPMIAVLTKFFATLWKLSDLKRRRVSPKEQAVALSINPYFMKEYETALGRYTVAEIENAFELLSEVDVRLKLSADQKVTMQTMLARLINTARPIV